MLRGTLNLATEVCPTVTTQEVPLHGKKQSTFLAPLMKRPVTSGKTVFFQSPDLMNSIETSFRLLKKIPEYNSSEVEPLTVPVSGKVGFSATTSITQKNFGFGSLETKDIPAKPPEYDIPMEVFSRSKGTSFFRMESSQLKAFQGILFAMMRLH